MVVNITVNPDDVLGNVTPYLYGACMEDVNHEIYGGLYDQKIFGESFEEPIPSSTFDEFGIYEGEWGYSDGELSVLAHNGAKIVYTPVEISVGSAEMAIRFDNSMGDNAGFLIYVSDVGNGADNFYGYEVSLRRDGRGVVIAKHKNNFEPIDEIPVNVNPMEWNNLKVAMNEGLFYVFLNGDKIFEYDAVDGDLASGNVAIRTWNSNTSFRDLVLTSNGVQVKPTFKSTPALEISSQWDAIVDGADGSFKLDIKGAFNGVNSQVIELTSQNGVLGISNAGLNKWGIAVGEGQTMQGSLYLKSNSSFSGDVIVALQSFDGSKEYAKATISGVGNIWESYPFNLTSDTDDNKARFAIYIDNPGKIWVDQVTLMNTADKQFRGLPMRKDIGEAMVNQGLTFLRYGGTMINIEGYRFKNMIGERAKRPPYRGHWYRYSTNGFGIEDFLQFCEAAGFTASFAINVEETPEDVADMIEYLNGPVSSEWGKKRADNGHPEPYNIKYIGIGNEEVLFEGDDSEGYDHYIERFNLLYDAIMSKDSSVSLINTAWWRPESPNMEKVFKALDGKTEYWDYHPWADELNSGEQVEAELREMQRLFTKWNPNTNMKCAIFEENGNTHNMKRVLGHVTIQNAVRRMGDFVLTSSAANALQPYKQNDNGWDQGQIFFTSSQVWGMPPYYAQQMASKYHHPILIKSMIVDSDTSLDITATRNENGDEVVLHIANKGDSVVPVNLTIDGFEKVKSAKAITLSGNLEDINTPDNPERIIPEEDNIKHYASAVYEVKPYSYTILVYSK